MNSTFKRLAVALSMASVLGLAALVISTPRSAFAANPTPVPTAAPTVAPTAVTMTPTLYLNLAPTVTLGTDVLTKTTWWLWSQMSPQAVSSGFITVTLNKRYGEAIGDGSVTDGSAVYTASVFAQRGLTLTAPITADVVLSVTIDPTSVVTYAWQTGVITKDDGAFNNIWILAPQGAVVSEAVSLPMMKLSAQDTVTLTVWSKGGLPIWAILRPPYDQKAVTLTLQSGAFVTTPHRDLPGENPFITILLFAGALVVTGLGVVARKPLLAVARAVNPFRRL